MVNERYTKKNRKYYVEIWSTKLKHDDFEKPYVLQSKWFDTENEAVEWAKTIDYLDNSFTKSLMSAIFDENGDYGDIEFMGNMNY